MSTISTDEIGKKLKTLAQYEIDDFFILNEAIDSVSDQKVKDKLQSFKQETEECIKDLSSLVEKIGGKPPSFSRDFKGFFMQGYTVMRGLVSDVGVLKALHTNEQLILNAYEKTLKSELPEDIRMNVKKCYEKDKVLDQYINEQINRLQ